MIILHNYWRKISLPSEKILTASNNKLLAYITENQRTDFIDQSAIVQYNKEHVTHT